MKRSLQEAGSSSASTSARPQSSSQPPFFEKLKAFEQTISTLDEDIFIHLHQNMKECETRQEVVTFACTYLKGATKSCPNPLQMRLADALNEDSRTFMSEQDWRLMQSFAMIPKEGSADLLLLEQGNMLCGILNIDRGVLNTTDSLEITIAVPTRQQGRSYSKLLIAVAVLIGYVESFPLLSYPSSPIFLKTILTNFDAVICLGDKLCLTTREKRMSKTDAENVVQEYERIKREHTVEQIGDPIIKIDNNEANLEYATTLLVSIPKLC